MQHPCHLDLLFAAEPTRLWDPEAAREVRVRRREVGGGNFQGLTAGDPLEGDLATVPWPTSTAPDLSEATVRSLVADLGGGETRAHALALCFGERPVATWEPVPLTVGATVGTCGFASATFLQRQRDGDHLHEVLTRYEDDDGHDLGCVLRFADGPVAIAGSGYGDGGYQLWWGRSADGAIVCVAYDFEVLNTNTFDEIELPLPLNKARLKSAALGGIRVRLPWLRGATKPRIDSTALPEHEWVYARVRRKDGGLRMPQLRTLASNIIELDLTAYGEDDALLLRHVRGTTPMPPAG